MAKSVKKKLFVKKKVSKEEVEVIDPSSEKNFDPKPGESVCRDKNII